MLVFLLRNKGYCILSDPKHRFGIQNYISGKHRTWGRGGGVGGVEKGRVVYHIGSNLTLSWIAKTIQSCHRSDFLWEASSSVELYV